MGILGVASQVGTQTRAAAMKLGWVSGMQGVLRLVELTVATQPLAE